MRYKFADIQLLVDADNYNIDLGQRQRNELELVPSSEANKQTVIQDGIVTRTTISFRAYIKSPDDYQKLLEYQIRGIISDFSGEVRYGSMFIWEIGTLESIRQGRYFTDIVLKEA